VRQILLNVVGNAIKFTDRGEVVLRVERERSAAEGDTVTLRFVVRDTGIGVPPDKQSAIFRAFEQADMSTTREYGGTGLGLTISTQLASLMGGTISVRSKPGRGSTFTVIVRFGRRADMPSGHVARARTELNGLRVLVVDDDAANRGIMHTWLRRWGMDVTGVADGTAAMDSMWQGVAAKRPYGMVLLDARIPDGYGFGLVARLREREELSGTRILLLKSGDSLGDRERVRDVRVDGELRKPVQEDVLIEMIYTVLTHPSGEETSPGRSTRLTAAPSVMAPALAPLSVLVAEDNEFNARLMEKLLIKRGHAVRLASDGREALKLLDASRFDMLLLDVHMPHLDGFKVIKAIRERERATGEHLPVIALTARSRKQDEELCLAAGMDGYLAKPIRTEDLWASIGRVAPTLRRHEPPPPTLLAPHVLLAACGADNQILRDICEGFLANGPVQLTALRDALLEHDTRRLREAAHKLSGMVSAFSTVAAALVSELEDLAEQGQLADTGTLVDRIDSSVHEIMTVLAGGVTVEQLHHDAGAPFPSA
jgi:CheY-like chemotaxis protein